MKINVCSVSHPLRDFAHVISHYSYLSFHRHRFPQGTTTTVATIIVPKEGEGEEDDNSMREYQEKSRKAKRRRGKGLIFENLGWTRTCDTTGNTNNGNEETGNNEPKNWLGTHLWHARRFHVSPSLSVFGNWCIPLIHSGRGSKAALRLCRTSCTVMDSTWTIGGTILRLSVPWEKRRSDGGGEVKDGSVTGGGDLLIPLLLRICGGGASNPFVHDREVLDGIKMGQGMIYGLDCSFPSSSALGPAKFLFGQDWERGESWVRIMVSPSILDRVAQVLDDLLSARSNIKKIGKENDQGKMRWCKIDGGMAMLQVRGLDATKCIHNSTKKMVHAVSRMEEECCCLDWNVISKYSDAHTVVPHGTIIPVSYDISSSEIHSKNESDSKSFDKPSTGHKDLTEYLEKTKIRPDDYYNQKSSFFSSLYNNKHTIFLISHSPSAPGKTNNKSSNILDCGWDILCHPTLVNDIFHSINISGKACAIGFAEDCALQLEADSPLLLWPRDYPETDVGRLYWSGESDEWNLIRYCVESGGGKINTDLRRLIKSCVNTNHCSISVVSSRTIKDISRTETVESIRSDDTSELINHVTPIQWDNVANSVGSNESINKTHALSVSVVRGDYITPFQDAISCLGEETVRTIYGRAKKDEGNHLTEKTRRRRPRRKVRSLCDVINASPLPRIEADSHQKMCRMLLASLSIPSLILCRLVMEGKGTLQSAMPIFTYDQRSFGSTSASILTGDSDGLSKKLETHHSQLLGYVTSGAFSPSKGKESGLGFIVAKHYLARLALGNGGACIISKESSGKLRFGMKVIIGTPICALTPKFASLYIVA